MTDLSCRVKEVYNHLHAIPEVGFEEYKTAAYLADQLQKAGYEVTTGVGGTGVIGTLRSTTPGPVVGLRADMDALVHTIGNEDVCIHSCGHDSHSAMVLVAAEELARQGIPSGTVKIVFQPAEEKLFGARRVIESGLIDDVDMMFGIHLRPIQEAKSGQATPALWHGASYIMEAVVEGTPAHGARPHLGVNAIDAAAAVVNAINAIHVNPTIPSTIKTTKFQAGGPTLNAIPDKAQLAFDLRAQNNVVMDELIAKANRAVEAGAATVGAKSTAAVKGGVPAAQYDKEMIGVAREAIAAVLGNEGLLDEIVTPGGEDFHFFVQHKPAMKTAYIGLGCDLTPGLHHPEMKFDTDALIHGVQILLHMVNKVVSK